MITHDIERHKSPPTNAADARASVAKLLLLQGKCLIEYRIRRLQRQDTRRIVRTQLWHSPKHCHMILRLRVEMWVGRIENCNKSNGIKDSGPRFVEEEKV